jgi:hypothetical protein
MEHLLVFGLPTAIFFGWIAVRHYRDEHARKRQWRMDEMEQTMQDAWLGIGKNKG